MGQRRPILPPGYYVEPEPTPLSDQEIDRLVGWIRSLDDPYILAYCLYWGFGAKAKLLQKTMGDEAVERKIRGFPNLCRRHLRILIVERMFCYGFILGSNLKGNMDLG